MCKITIETVISTFYPKGFRKLCERNLLTMKKTWDAGRKLNSKQVNVSLSISTTEYAPVCQYKSITIMQSCFYMKCSAKITSTVSVEEYVSW